MKTHLPDCACDECVGVPAFEECGFWSDLETPKCGACESCLAVEEFDRRLREQEAMANGGVSDFGMEVLSWE